MNKGWRGGIAALLVGLAVPAAAQTGAQTAAQTGTEETGAEETGTATELMTATRALRGDVERLIASIEAERADLAGRATNPGAEDALGVLVSEIIFQPGDVTIPTDARQRLTGVAEALHRVGTVRLHVVGYSDRTGPQAVNVALAFDRADAVASILTAAGFPATDIAVVSALEAGLPLPVPTPDGVAEPRNRSARIFAAPAG